MYFLVLFRPGPAWRLGASLDEQPFTVEHAVHLQRLYQEQKVFMGGRVGARAICFPLWCSKLRARQKLLRIGAAAHELGLHPITVRRWIKAGRIQVVQMGREVRVPRAEIERMVGKLNGRLLVLYGRVSGQGQKS